MTTMSDHLTFGLYAGSATWMATGDSPNSRVTQFHCSDRSRQSNVPTASVWLSHSGAGCVIPATSINAGRGSRGPIKMTAGARKAHPFKPFHALAVEGQPTARESQLGGCAEAATRCCGGKVKCLNRKRCLTEPMLLEI